MQMTSRMEGAKGVTVVAGRSDAPQLKTPSNSPQKKITMKRKFNRTEYYGIH